MFPAKATLYIAAYHDGDYDARFVTLLFPCLNNAIKLNDITLSSQLMQM